MRAALVGGADGPSGWALSNGVGGRTTMSLEALLCLEHKLRGNRDTDTADDLHRQMTTLARIAEAWRQRHRDRLEGLNTQVVPGRDAGQSTRLSPEARPGQLLPGSGVAADRDVIAGVR